jgi:hypothetical protein
MFLLQGASMADKPSQLSDPVGNPDDSEIVTSTQRGGYHPIYCLPGFLKEKLAQLDVAASQMNTKADDT